MIPVIDDTFFDLPTETEYASTDFALDTNKLNGRIDGLEEIKQAIYFILNSERFDYEIYPWSYGFETKDLIGMDFDYVEAILEDRIKEALMQDTRITSVDSFVFEKKKNVLNVTFDVTTSQGTIESEVNVDV